jgi:hypothetical protein
VDRLMGFDSCNLSGELDIAAQIVESTYESLDQLGTIAAELCWLTEVDRARQAAKEAVHGHEHVSKGPSSGNSEIGARMGSRLSYRPPTEHRRDII